METQYERRIAILERQLSEACATIQGLRLALEEAQKQIAELTRLHVCVGAAVEPPVPAHPVRKGGNRG
jgi:phage shock protein A